MSQTVLFKQDASGRIREWATWIEQSTLLIRHGLNAGEKQFERIQFDTFDEARAEMNSRINRRRDRLGYTDHVPQCRPFRPMLAETYSQETMHAVPDIVYIQPKLDGFRCLASHNWMKGRNGLHIHIMKHIQAQLAPLPPEIVVDGELYIHGLSFQEISKHVTPDRPTPTTPSVELHLFDIADTTLPFSSRFGILKEIINEISEQAPDWPCPICQHSDSPYQPLTSNPHCYFCKGSGTVPLAIKTVETLAIKSSDIAKHLQYYLNKGYEGMMIRDPKGMYETGTRSMSLLKLKPKDQDNYIIVDIIGGKGRYAKQAILVCETTKGDRFQAALAMPEYARTAIFINRTKYIGKLAHIEYLELTGSGVPRHPSAKAIHP